MFAVTVHGRVVTSSALRVLGWVERAETLDRAGGRAVFPTRDAADEFAAWMGRTFPEPPDHATVVAGEAV